MDPVVITKTADVEAALLNPLLVPPAPSRTLRPGATSDLREGMARFSTAETHSLRRLAVDETVAAIASYRFAAEAHRRASAIVTGATRQLDASADIGFIVPCHTVAAALGVPDEALELVRIQVRAIVEVIGRHQPSNPGSDLAADQLTDLIGRLGHDPVAGVSLLYQTHDATAALLASTLVADQTGSRRRTAVGTTSRTATAATAVGDISLSPAQRVVVDLETSRFEFGLGPHRCPGTQIAQRLVAGMVEALHDAGLVLDLDRVDRHPDGRPAALPLIPAKARSLTSECATNAARP